jgi:osmotically-inducible protein OsmY
MSERATSAGAGSGDAGPAPKAGEGQQIVDVGARVEGSDGPIGRVLRVFRDPDTGRITHLAVHRSGLLGRDLVVPVEGEIEVERDRVRLSTTQAQLGALPEYRPDHAIRRDVLQALWDERLHHTESPALRVDVLDGRVTLRGHLADRQRRAKAEAAARRVRGVREVRNRLVADDDLEAAIQRALVEDPRTTGQAIAVRVTEGIVQLSGGVSSGGERATFPLGWRTCPLGWRTCAEVVAGVPGVRGMICQLSGLEAFHPEQEPQQEVMLPAIGTRVFASDGLLGHLEQVVVNPRLRAVTHLIVTLGPKQHSRRVVVPVGLVKRWVREAEMVDEGATVLLHISRVAAVWLPEFSEEGFVVPGPEWQPPFDYERAEVRFAAEAGDPQP